MKKETLVEGSYYDELSLVKDCKTGSLSAALAVAKLIGKYKLLKKSCDDLLVTSSHWTNYVPKEHLSARKRAVSILGFSSNRTRRINAWATKHSPVS